MSDDNVVPIDRPPDRTAQELVTQLIEVNKESGIDGVIALIATWNDEATTATAIIGLLGALMASHSVIKQLVADLEAATGQ